MTSNKDPNQTTKYLETKEEKTRAPIHTRKFRLPSSIYHFRRGLMSQQPPHFDIKNLFGYIFRALKTQIQLRKLRLL